MPQKQMCRKTLSLALLTVIGCLSGCSMGEEIRRIEEVKRQQAESSAARSTNLTGEQIFIRSCNTCHPAGKLGMGPSLIDIDKRYPEDAALKQLIRKGKGIMPPQPASTINEEELNHLVAYLRKLTKELQENEAKK